MKDVIEHLKAGNKRREIAINDLRREAKKAMRDMEDLHTRHCEAIGEIPCLAMYRKFGKPIQWNKTNNRKRKKDTYVKVDNKRRRADWTN